MTLLYSLMVTAALVGLICCRAGPTAPETVTVAVYEHQPEEALEAKDWASAVEIMMLNVDILDEQMEEAAAQGVKVFVFPEYGLTSSSQNISRSSLYNLLHIIPEPNSHGSCMDCDGAVKEGTEIVQAVGCLAREYDMYLAVNLLEKVPCSNSNSDCPSDGHFQYNTNIVFNRTGCLIAKYHKYAPYISERYKLDFPDKPQHVYFDTEFGRFGTKICFDLLFSEDVGGVLAEDYQVDTILFTTDWAIFKSDVAIITNVVQVSSGWARAHGVNILTANTHDINWGLSGSAITTPDGIEAAYYSQTSQKGRLLVADIPIKTTPRKQSSRPVPFLTENTASYSHTETMTLSHYSSAILTEQKGSVQLCHKHVCCHLDYIKDGNHNETYRLAAYVGHLPRTLFEIEMCVVRRCPEQDLDSCLVYADTEANTRFTKLVLTGTFGEELMLPTVSGAGSTFLGMDFDYNHVGNIHQIVGMNLTEPLLTAALVSWDPVSAPLRGPKSTSAAFVNPNTASSLSPFYSSNYYIHFVIHVFTYFCTSLLAF